MTRVAIVTGSSSGIGAACAVELSKRGWSVVVNYSKSAGEAQKVAAQCKDAIAVQADVGEDADCRRLAQAALDKWGRIDALVNNAGTTKFVKHADLDGLSAEDFLRIYRLNVVGPFQMMRACAAALKATKGAVVNVSSVASLLGTGSSIAYAASKAALNAMTCRSRASLGAGGARQRGVPRLRRHALAAQRARHGQGAARRPSATPRMVPLKDYARPEDVAEAIAWLIEGARQVTGEMIFVDGGMHIQPAPR